MRRLVPALLVLLVVSGAFSVNAQTTVTPTETPVAPEVTSQEVLHEGRRYTLNPFYLFTCFITERTTKLGHQGRDLQSDIALQCFIRQGDEMVPVEEARTSDSGISLQAEVGQGIISTPQVETDPLDGEVSP